MVVEIFFIAAGIVVALAIVLVLCCLVVAKWADDDADELDRGNW